MMMMMMMMMVLVLVLVSLTIEKDVAADVSCDEYVLAGACSDLPLRMTFKFDHKTVTTRRFLVFCKRSLQGKGEAS